jgi:predicted TIM-barrel enzyme
VLLALRSLWEVSDVTLAADAGAVVVSGTAAGLRADQRLVAAAGSFVITSA